MARETILIALACACRDPTAGTTTVETARARISCDAACAERSTLPAHAARDGHLIEPVGGHGARAHEYAHRQPAVATSAAASTACRGTTAAARGVLEAVAVAAADTVGAVAAVSTSPTSFDRLFSWPTEI